MKRGTSIMDPIYRIGLSDAPRQEPRAPMRAFCDNNRCGDKIFTVPGAGRMRWVENAGSQAQVCPECGRALYWSTRYAEPAAKATKKSIETELYDEETSAD